MANKERLKQLLAKLDSLEQREILASSDVDKLIKEEVSGFAKQLQDNPTIKILNKFNGELTKFKKDFNLKPISNSIKELEVEITENQKELVEEFKTELTNKVSEFTSNLDKVRKSIPTLPDPFDSSKLERDIRVLRELIFAKQDFDPSSLEKDLGNIKKQLQDLVDNDIQSDTELRKDVENKLQKEIDKLKKDFFIRLSNLGGGNANRNIAINGNTSVLSRYTDINFKPGANVTFTTSNNNTTKYLDFTIAAAGGGSGSPGGNDTEVQFNDNGSFGGGSVFTYNPNTSILQTGKTLNSEYLRVGSGVIPVSSTVGDITALRLNLGNNAHGTNGQIIRVTGTMTDTANTATMFAGFSNTIAPTANSDSTFRALNFANAASPGTGITLDEIEGIHVEGARFGANMDSQINAVVGANIQGAVPDSGANAGLRISTIEGLQVFGVTRPSGTSSIFAATVSAVDVHAIQSGIVIATNVNGIVVNNPGNGSSIATLIGLDIATQTRASTTGIGLRIARPSGATNNYALQLSDTSSIASGGITFGTDTTLYRSAANTLKTDDAFSVGTQGSVTGAITLHGLTSGTMVVQPASVAGSWTMTLPVNDGSAGQYLLTDGNGITQWASVTASGGSGITRSTSIITADTTAADTGSTDYVYFINAGLRFTLPAAVGNTNLYTVKNHSASSVLVLAGEGIDGSASALMALNNESLSFVSNSSIWAVV